MKSSDVLVGLQRWRARAASACLHASRNEARCVTPDFRGPSAQNGWQRLSVLTSRGKTQEGTSHVDTVAHAKGLRKGKGPHRKHEESQASRNTGWMTSSPANRNCLIVFELRHKKAGLAVEASLFCGGHGAASPHQSIRCSGRGGGWWRFPGPRRRRGGYAISPKIALMWRHWPILRRAIMRKRLRLCGKGREEIPGRRTSAKSPVAGGHMNASCTVAAGMVFRPLTDPAVAAGVMAGGDVRSPWFRAARTLESMDMWLIIRPQTTISGCRG